MEANTCYNRNVTSSRINPTSYARRRAACGLVTLPHGPAVGPNLAALVGSFIAGNPGLAKETCFIQAEHLSGFLRDNGYLDARIPTTTGHSFVLLSGDRIAIDTYELDGTMKGKIFPFSSVANDPGCLEYTLADDDVGPRKNK